MVNIPRSITIYLISLLKTIPFSVHRYIYRNGMATQEQLLQDILSSTSTSTVAASLQCLILDVPTVPGNSTQIIYSSSDENNAISTLSSRGLEYEQRMALVQSILTEKKNNNNKNERVTSIQPAVCSNSKEDLLEMVSQAIERGRDGIVLRKQHSLHGESYSTLYLRVRSYRIGYKNRINDQILTIFNSSNSLSWRKKYWLSKS